MITVRQPKAEFHSILHVWYNCSNITSIEISPRATEFFTGWGY